MLYTAASRSLAALEVLAHFNVLPRDYVATPIEIPDQDLIKVLSTADLPPDWNAEPPTSATQDLGRRWVLEAETPVLQVPSCIVPAESNYVINVNHPDFNRLIFRPSEPFAFDPRLKG